MMIQLILKILGSFPFLLNVNPQHKKAGLLMQEKSMIVTLDSSHFNEGMAKRAISNKVFRDLNEVHQALIITTIRKTEFCQQEKFHPDLVSIVNANTFTELFNKSDISSNDIFAFTVYIEE